MEFDLSPLYAITVCVAAWLGALGWFGCQMQRHNRSQEDKPEQETHPQHFGVRSVRSGRDPGDPYDTANNKGGGR